jgi:UDP-glucose 4-epimerase
MIKNMNIVITGGAGFIGSHLADELIERGDSVYIIDNLETGRRDNINSKAVFIEGDIADADTIKELFDLAQPDVVIHAAASYKDQSNWSGDILANVLGSANLVKAALAHDVEKFIYFQTALCYGHEPDVSPIPLLHHIDPDNSYSVSKTAGEQYIRFSDINSTSFRLANVYGPRNLSGPVPTFFHRLNNNDDVFISSSRRDFIYIKDLVRIVLANIDGVGERDVYHISSGEDCSIEEIFEIVADEMGVDKNVQASYGRFKDDTKTLLIDPSITLKDFNYIPDTPMSVGIPKALEWYRQNGVTETYTHLSAEQLRTKAREHLDE